jgi:SAM-dependent methyltransferase
MKVSPKAEAQRLARVEKSRRENYFKSCPEGYLVSQAGRADLNNQVSMRLLKDRTRIVPWINSIHDLDGASVLEIGCGTGSSTVALAERGAVLTAIDIDAASIAVARERCSAYEVAAAFHVASAARLPEDIREQQYEIIIFYASLEHMTVVGLQAASRACPTAARQPPRLTKIRRERCAAGVTPCSSSRPRRLGRRANGSAAWQLVRAVRPFVATSLTLAAFQERRSAPFGPADVPPPTKKRLNCRFTARGSNTSPCNHSEKSMVLCEPSLDWRQIS